MAKQRFAPGADEHVLDCAARLFRERGFEATTVRDIARTVGMLPGSLHYRYPTKGALLLALMRRGLALDLAAVDAAIAGAVDPVERLRLALRAHLRFLVSRDSTSVVLFEWRSIEPEAHAEMVRLRDEYDAHWARLIADAHAAGRLGAHVDLKMLRLMIFGAANWVSMWYSPGGPRTSDEIADAFWEYLSAGVLTSAAR
ncbi:MAG: TetR family transcriptional regulator [Acidobacteria bacterium]|nr:TetR family transcriptional regulator [Acidobacteriota bacterium]